MRTAARRSWAEKNQDAVTRYLRGLAAAFQFIRDQTHRPAVVKTIIQWTDSPPDIAEQTLKLYFEPERNVFASGKARLTSKEWLRSLPSWPKQAQSRCRLPPAERSLACNAFAQAGIQR